MIAAISVFFVLIDKHTIADMSSKDRIANFTVGTICIVPVSNVLANRLMPPIRR